MRNAHIEACTAVASIALAVAAMATIGCGSDMASSPDANEPVVAPAAFTELCSHCHGPGGDGTSDAPQIREPVHAYAEFTVRTGRMDQMGFGQDMPSFDAGSLADADLADILAFLDRAPRPTDGHGLFVRFCANCHGADARGGRVGEGIAGEADDVFERVRGGHGGTSYGARREYMPAWSTSQLSDDEVDAIASYLGTLPGGGDDGDDGDD